MRERDRQLRRRRHRRSKRLKRRASEGVRDARTQPNPARVHPGASRRPSKPDATPDDAKPETIAHEAPVPPVIAPEPEPEPEPDELEPDELEPDEPDKPDEPEPPSEPADPLDLEDS